MNSTGTRNNNHLLASLSKKPRKNLHCGPEGPTKITAGTRYGTRHAVPVPEMLLDSVVLWQPPLLPPPPYLTDGGDAGLRVVKGIPHQAGAQPALRLCACDIGTPHSRNSPHILRISVVKPVQS